MTGIGVKRLSDEIGVFPYSGVPVPENCQLTVAEGLFSIPLPVDTKENKTVDPAHTLRVFDVCWGSVTKFANKFCPKTIPFPAKTARATKTILKIILRTEKKYN